MDNEFEKTNLDNGTVPESRESIGSGEQSNGANNTAFEMRNESAEQPRQSYGAPYGQDQQHQGNGAYQQQNRQYGGNGNYYRGGQQSAQFGGYNGSQYQNPNGAYGGNPYNGYGYGCQSNQNRKNTEKKGASKGFVIGAVAVGMVLCILFGAFAGVALFASLDSGSLNIPTGNGGTVIIEHEYSDVEVPTVTDKGDPAYVASIASKTVVEVKTETVSTDTYFGQYVTEGAGSGVIISSGDEGTYIITCAHVIDGATKVTVTLKDGTDYEASFIAGDALTDIGIIKIDVKGLPAATVGDFSKVVVGEEVVAIGNPLGELGGSVTNGIVSALDREVMIDGTSYNLLQTNAEINPGNSGGGLFNADGNLIGIVNAKSSGENVEGLGFAIPIDDGMKIAEELILNGYVTGRVKLGVMVIEILDQEDYLQNLQYGKYFTGFGVYIIESENSGLQLGDRLVAVNSIEITNTTALKSALLDFEVGDVVTVSVARLNNRGQSEIVNVEITLKEMTN